MKRIRAAFLALSVVAVFGLEPVARASPVVTVCASGSITVNGDSVVDEAHCIEV